MAAHMLQRLPLRPSQPLPHRLHPPTVLSHRPIHTTPPPSRTYYQVLHLTPKASMSEVKLSYLTLAKKLHPDSGQSHSSQPFVDLVEAYECLSCPYKRAEYDATLNAPCSRPRTNTATRRATFGFQEPYRHGRAWARETELMRVRKGETLLRRLQMELDDAMDMAYNGPQVPEFDQLGLTPIKMLPWAFEAELRTSQQAHEDIMQIVSGRQYLGQVSQASRRREIQVSGETSGTGKERGLEMTFQHARVAHGVERVNDDGQKEIRVFGNDLAAPVGSAESARMLHLGTVRCIDQSPTSLRASLMDAIRSIPKPKFSNRIREDKPKTLPLGAELAPKCFAVLNADYEETHCVVQLKSLGVSYQYWFRKDPTLKLEIKASRAWLPSPRFWLWEPRSEDHIGGSWYYEIARPKIESEALCAVALESLSKVSEVERLSDAVKFQWAVEAAAARVRRFSGAIDPRVSLLFTAFAEREAA